MKHALLGIEYCLKLILLMAEMNLCSFYDGYEIFILYRCQGETQYKFGQHLLKIKSRICV